jgi:hypothetical protein
VSFSRCTAIGGTSPAVQLDAKGIATAARFSDCIFSNGAGATADPAPVVTMEPCDSGKFRKLHGPYPYGAVSFENVTIVLGGESLPARKHHRAWLTVIAADGLSHVALNASVWAGPDSGGCALVKEEYAQAKQPWTRVKMGHSCQDSPTVNWISKETKQVGRSFSATAPSTTMATTLVDDLVHFRRGRRRHSR